MKKIDKVLKELSSLYELNRVIITYKFKDKKRHPVIQSAESKYKLRPSSD